MSLSVRPGESYAKKNKERAEFSLNYYARQKGGVLQAVDDFLSGGPTIAKAPESRV